MPVVPDDFVTPDVSLQSASDHEAVNEEIQSARTGWLGGLFGSAALAPIDLIDTVASSIPFVGSDRGTVNDKFLSAFGGPGLRRFAEEQKGATELISGIAGIAISDGIAGRMMATGSPVMRGLRQMPGVRKIAALDKSYDQALRAAQVGMREAASRGEMGAATMSGVLNYQSFGVKTTLDLGKARAGVVNLGRARGTLRAAGTELVMSGLMNTNSIFFSDDTLDNVANAAIGIGIGGFLGGIQGGWELRKAANSRAMEAEAIRAFDPKGHEASRRAIGVDDVLGKNYLGYDHELETGLITSQLIHANELRLATNNTESGQRLFSNRSTFSTELEAQGFTNLNKVTTSGLNGVSGTSFNDSEKAFAGLRGALHNEPTLIYAASEIGVPNGWAQGKLGMGITLTDAARTTAIESRQDAISKIFKQGGLEKIDPKTGKTFIEPLSKEMRVNLQEEMRKLWYDRSKQGFVMLNQGELAPIEFGQVVDKFNQRGIVREASGGKVVWKAEQADPAVDSLIGIGDDLSIYTTKNRPLSHVSTHDAIQFYQIARHVTDRLAKGPNVILLPKNPNWAQLDMAERIIQKSGNPAKVTFPDGMTRQDALVESFAQKVDAIRAQMSSGKGTKKPILGAKSYAKSRPPLNDVDAFAARLKFNMPQLTPQQSALLRTHENPFERVLYGFTDGDQVRQLGYDGLKNEIKKAGQIQGLNDEIMRPFEEMNGKSFDFMMDADGKPLTPVMIYKRSLDPDDWSRKGLDTMIAHRKAFQRQVLIGDTANPLLKEWATQLLASPDMAVALNVNALSDNQHFSWIPGMVNKPPQSFFGSWTDSLNFAGREFRDRDNLQMLAAQRIKDLQDRITRAGMHKTVTDVMGDVMNRIAAPRAGESRVMLNHFFAQRQGWDLVEKPLTGALPDGRVGYKFELADTPKNHERFELQYNRPMDKGEVLLNAQEVPIVLDELGFEGLNRFNQLAEIRRDMQNTLLRSQGLPEIQRQPWWVPSPETRGKFVAFTFDANGKVVPGMAVIANTAEQLDAGIAKLNESPRMQPGMTIRKRDNVTAFMDLWDKAQMDWHDAASAVVNTGKVNRGRMSTQEIDLKAWDRANSQMVDSLLEQGSDLLNILTKDSVVNARARAQVGRAETAIGKSDRQVKHQGIFDRYIENITGRSASQNRDNTVNKIFNAAEDSINDFLREQSPRTSQIYGALQDKFRTVNPFAKTDTNQELFDKLVKNLGPYMPFNSVADMVEAQTGHALPKEIKQISSKLSWMEATSKLRWFESVHAIMNVGSLIHNLPSILKGIQRLPGESDELWGKRIGHSASIFGSGQNQVATPNIAKILYGAFADSYKPAFDEFTTKAFQRGYMDQEIAELERQFNTIKTPGNVRAFLFGDSKVQIDPNASGWVKFAQKVKKEGGLDHYLGRMSDASEDYTRRVAMYFGRRVAKLQGIDDVDSQLDFAHTVANMAIANYNPRNRPAIFQGAFGAPIGLFQSYVANYYGRMFRLFETGNTRALASQFVWQSGVFGVKSFGPFWNQANAMFFDRGGVLNEEATDSFEHRLGTTEGDILSYGVIANLPKLFGGEGASVYTRGDINVRLPVVNMPIADSVARIWNGVTTGLDAMFNNVNGLSGQQAAEILSNTIGNRPIAGLIETFAADGYDTAKTGEVVSKNVFADQENFSYLNAAYRLMGIKSMKQQKEVEGFYADKQAGEQQAARQTRLRLETRSAVRAGDLDALPDLFVQYVKNGGDVKYFTRWYNDAMESSIETRSERRLQDLIKNGKKMASVNRLIDAGVDPLDEDEADDYGAEEEQKTRIRAQIDEMLTQQNPDVN